jgi:hypothetical protein
VVAHRGSHEIVKAGDDRMPALKEIAARGAPVTLVVSNHYARYCLLSSNALSSDRDWIAYARHVLTATYGGDSASWVVRLTRTETSDCRVACALDAGLVDELSALPGLQSLQPYLMAAFNPRRRALRSATAWIVFQEPGRMLIGFLDRGTWRVLRVRQATDDWQRTLPDLLDREAAIAGTASCDRLFVCAEEEVPPEIGRYQTTDISLVRGAGGELRPYLMTLH